MGLYRTRTYIAADLCLLFPEVYCSTKTTPEVYCSQLILRLLARRFQFPVPPAQAGEASYRF